MNDKHVLCTLLVVAHHSHMWVAVNIDITNLFCLYSSVTLFYFPVDRQKKKKQREKRQQQ